MCEADEAASSAECRLCVETLNKESPRVIRSLHMIAGQFLLVAPPRAVIADSGGSGGSPVAIGTGDGFGVSLVAGGSDLNLLQRSNRGQNGAFWRSLEPPIVTFILTGH